MVCSAQDLKKKKMHSSQEEREPRTGELGCLPTPQLFLSWMSASTFACSADNFSLHSSAIGHEQVSAHYSN